MRPFTDSKIPSKVLAEFALFNCHANCVGYLASLDLRTSVMKRVSFLDSQFKYFYVWRPQGDSNPRRQRERLVS